MPTVKQRFAQAKKALEHNDPQGVKDAFRGVDLAELTDSEVRRMHSMGEWATIALSLREKA